MALVLKDRVKETTTSTSTGTVILAGAVTGYQSFSVIGNANTTYYAIVSQTGAEWEVGIGTYTAVGTTLSRNTVLSSSNGGSLVNFSAGEKQVFVTYPADRSIYADGTILTTTNNAVLPVASGGTGQTSYTDGQLLIGNSVGTTLTKATLSAGTGIGISNGNGSITVTNNAPDQVVSLTGSGATSISGTYPSFTISSPALATSTSPGLIELGSDTVQATAPNAVTSTALRTYALQLNASGQAVLNVPWVDTVNPGTVTSVGGTGTVSGITLSGTVTSSGNLTLGGTLAVTPANFAAQNASTFLASPTGSAGSVSFRAVAAGDIPTLNQNTTGTAANVTGTVAVANGGTGATTAAAARTNLGATTLGSNVFTIANPNAVTFPRFNADNTVSSLDAATFRTAIGAGAGTVTSVATSGTVSGITLTGGPITSTGTVTLGGTLAVTASNFASQTANTFLAAPNGVAGVPTFRAVVAADIPTLNQNTTGSAATLTTARNINGTSFNGSADITTANWGTARTLWGQSVNGSANITAPLQPAAGSISAPAFSTSGDTDTGVYFPVAGQVALAANGVGAGNYGTFGQGFKNRMLNGAMEIWQRGTSFVGIGAGNYTADRWQTTLSGITMTVTQSTDVPSALFRTSLSAVPATNATASEAGMRQYFETQMGYGLAGNPVTISVYVKCSQTLVRLRVRADGTGGTDNNQSVAVTAGTWTRISATFNSFNSLTAFTTAANASGGWVDIGFANNTALTTADYLIFTGVQLESGSIATPYWRLPYPQDLQLCQRYYYRNTAGAIGDRFSSGFCLTTTNFDTVFSFPVTMRAAPTSLGQSGTITDYSVYSTTTVTCSNVPSFQSATTNEGTVRMTVASGLTAGFGGLSRAAAATAYFAWAAEL